MAQHDATGPLRIYRPPITVAEAAVYLSVRESFVRQLVMQRRIPFIKIGTGKRSPIRFLPDDLDRWLEGLKVEPEPAVEQA